MSECIEAVEKVFAMHARQETSPPGVLGMPLSGGGFHIKAAAAEIDEPFFAAKINANFPGNPARFGLPTIQGILVLFDAVHGAPLAVMDSAEITAIRTAAATAVAAKYLARRSPSTVAICGCGQQSRSQLRAIMEVRTVTGVFAYDKDVARAEQYADFVRKDLRLDSRVADNLRDATRNSDITVTCTTSQQHFLGVDDVSPGAFIAAVGADNPEKQEIDPAFLASSTLVVDLLEQCAEIGDLHHALAARGDRGVGPLKIPFAFVVAILAVGFCLALILPATESPTSELWLGLPARAAIIIYGIGLLPTIVLPVAYALTFESQTLSADDIERVRSLARQIEQERRPTVMRASESPS